MAVALERRFVFAVDFDERAIAPLAVGKAEQLFRMVAVGESWRIAVIVGNAVLNPGQPRRVQITHPSCLDRCGALCENAQVREAGGTGQIDQDVYPVLM